MANNLTWQEIEISPVGLNEAVDSRVLPPGQLVEAENCEFTTKDGSLRKRAGTVRRATFTDPPLLTKEVVHGQKNQVLGVDLGVRAASAAAGHSAALYALQETDESFRHVGMTTKELIERYPLAPDLQSDVVADMAYCNGFLVFGIVHLQTAAISIKVVEMTGLHGGAHTSSACLYPGNTVLEQEIPYGRGAFGSAFHVRASASGEVTGNTESTEIGVLVTFQFQKSGAGIIAGAFVNCAPDVPTVSSSAPTVLFNDLPPDTNDATFHDTCESTTLVDLNRANWGLIYTNSSEEVVMARVQVSAGVPAVTWDEVVWNTALTSPRATSVFEFSGAMYGNWFVSTGEDTGAWTYCVRNTDDGTSVLAATTWCDSSDIGAEEIQGQGWVSGISKTNGGTGDVVLFHSQYHFHDLDHTAEPPGFRTRFMTRWRRVRTGGGMDALRQKRGLRMFSKPWPDTVDGWYLCWNGLEQIIRLSRAGEDSGDFIPGYGNPEASPETAYLFASYALTGCLVRFCEAAAEEDGMMTAQLVNTVAGLSLGDPHRSVPEGDLGIPRLFQVPSSVTQAALETPTSQSSLYGDPFRAGRRCCLNVQYVPGEAKSGPWDVGVRWYQHDEFRAGYGRHQSVRYGGSTYMAGGMLSQWDGDKHHECGFVAAPNVSMIQETSGGSWNEFLWAEKRLFLQAVYEVVTESGERIRSAPSAVVEVLLGGTQGSVAAPDLLHLFIEPPTVTMRGFGVPDSVTTALKTPRVICTVYGSTVIPNSSGNDSTPGDTLYRWFEFTAAEWDLFVGYPDGAESLQSIQIRFDGNGSGGAGAVFPYNTSSSGGGTITALEILETHEVIYDDSGELRNRIPFEGCSALCVHKNRLWVAGGGQPDVISYSKEKVPGRGAEFALEQTQTIPDQHRVVALESDGEALVVLCESAVFLLYGDGPDATGQNGGFEIVQLSLAKGCRDPVALATPSGVIFRSESGFWRVRGRSLEFVGKPVRDTVRALPAISSARSVPHLNQARFVTTDDDGVSVLVYDWEADRWATSRYSVPIYDIGVTGGRTFILGGDIGGGGSTMLEEDAATWSDDGEPYYQRVVTGWLSFGKMQGFKNLGRSGLLLSPNPWASHVAIPPLFPFALDVTYDYNYAESGFTSLHQFSNADLGGILPQDGISWLRVDPTYMSQPSIRLTMQERPPVMAIPGEVFESYDTRLGKNVLRVRTAPGDPWTVLTVTEALYLFDPTPLMADLQAQIDASVLAGLVYAIYVGGLGPVLISGPGVFYLEVDSVANGSTLNDVLGFAAAGEVGNAAVEPEARSGFVWSSAAFEVGFVPDKIRRLPAAQTR